MQSPNTIDFRGQISEFGWESIEAALPGIKTRAVITGISTGFTTLILHGEVVSFTAVRTTSF